MGRCPHLLLHRHGEYASFGPQGRVSVAVALKLTLTTQAKNIINYLRIIHRILAPGGVWINLGKSHHRTHATAAADTHSADRTPIVALGEQHDE